MVRLHKHPDVEVERLLQELERCGLASDVAERFALRAAARHEARRAGVRADMSLGTSCGSVSCPHPVSLQSP